MKPIQGRLESVSKLSKKLKTELDRYSAQKTQEVTTALQNVAIQTKHQLPLSFHLPCRVALHCRTRVLLHPKDHLHFFCGRKQQVGWVIRNVRTLHSHAAKTSGQGLQCILHPSSMQQQGAGKYRGWQITGRRGKT